MQAKTSQEPGDRALLVRFDALFARAPIAAMLVDARGVVLGTNAAFDSFVADGCSGWRGHCLDEMFAGFEEEDFGRVCAEAEDGTPGGGVLSSLGIANSDAVHTFDLHFMSFSAHGERSDVYLAYVLARSGQSGAGLQMPVHGSKSPGGLETQDALVRAATEAAGVAAWTLCPKTGQAWCSDMWFKLLGYESQVFQISVDSFFELMHPDDREATLTALAELVKGETASFQSDFRLRAADGTWRWIGAAGSIMPGRQDGQNPVVYGTQTDIGWRKDTEERLKAKAQCALAHRDRLDYLAENSPVGLFEFRLHQNGSIEFPYVSQGVIDTLGVSRDEMEENGTACFRNVLPEYIGPMNEAIKASQADLSPFRFRYRVAHPLKGIIWVQAISLPTLLPDGTTTWHGSLYDITPEVKREADLKRTRDQAVRMQKQMEVLALHDVLTGLPNRRYFDLRMQYQRERAFNGQDDGKVTLVRVDLDHFKYVNDNLGHDAGDAVLIHVARLLQEGVRDCDFVARIGGDEFSIILGDGGSTDLALEMIEGIQLGLSQAFLYHDQICRFGASFGIASCRVQNVEEGELHAFADAALYEAKAKGRNRVEVFTRSLHNHIIEHRRLAGEIEEALEHGEFEPFFQPQICARTRELVGLETLARWRHPDRGLLLPDEFITVAEQIRVVPIIDQMMLEKSAEILGRWRKAGFIPPKISFNVSSGRLHDPEILNAARMIRNEGTVVAFELLESILVEDENEEFRFNLDALKDSGILIEIDDFGSGHASIIGVMETEPSVLKIDKRLSCSVAENPQARELIAAIVRISDALGISTTVEGVETAEQARILTDLGCDVLQGFFFSKPLSEMEVLAFTGRLRSQTA